MENFELNDLDIHSRIMIDGIKLDSSII